MAGLELQVSVIIVSYNTCEMTLSCLRTLQCAMLGMRYEIIVVDNASKDGSPDAIRREFPNIKLIQNHTNAGFGAASNRGMQAAAGQFFFLLNSDAFVDPQAIRLFLEKMNSDQKLGLLGPRLLNQDGSLQRSCFRFASPGRVWLENLWISSLLRHHPVVQDYRHWAHDCDREVDWVSGAAMFVRRTAFEKVGGFDERFFMYAEETDWQRRMRDCGWKIGFVPSAKVTHLGGASGLENKPAMRNHFFQSLDYYELKHHGWLGLVSLRLAMLVGCTLRGLGWWIIGWMPSRRSIAAAKVELMLWLCLRQITNWDLLKDTMKLD